MVSQGKCRVTFDTYRLYYASNISERNITLFHFKNNCELSEYFYEHIPQGCVNGHNIVLHHNLNIEECKNKCNKRTDCMAIEYGVDYGAVGGYKAKDCRLQNGVNRAGCDGKLSNWDLYVKKGMIIKL